MVNGAVPAAVGVPETEFDASVIPGGGAPALIDQVYGGLPPVAANETVGYAIPTSPKGMVPGVMASGGSVGVAVGRVVVGVLRGVLGGVATLEGEAAPAGDSFATGETSIEGEASELGLGTPASGARAQAAASSSTPIIADAQPLLTLLYARV